MKKFLGFFIVILLSLLFFKGAFAQPIEGKRFEFSISASMWNVKYGDYDTETVFNLPFRFGCFVFKGLEIETELFLTIEEYMEDIGILVLANLSYNFKIHERIIPFVLGGLGYGNATHNFSMAVDRGYTVTAFNFGAGVKLLVVDSAGIRLEYRFTKYSEEERYSYWDYDRTDNNILLGISIFF